MPKNGFSTLTNILLMLIVITAVGIGVFFWQERRLELAEKENKLIEQVQNKKSNAHQPATETKPATTTVTVTEIKDDKNNLVDATNNEEQNSANENNIEPSNLAKISGMIYLGKNYSLNEGQNKIDSATLNQLSSSSEKFTSEIMPISEKNPAKFYFSTLKTETGKMPVSKIYSFETNTNKLRELYWERYGQEILLIGIEGDKLLAYQRKIGTTNDKCFIPWIDAKVVYLDLTNPTGGFNDYTVSEDLAKQARAAKGNCQ